MDFLLAMLSVYPRRLNAVAAQKFFLYRPLSWLMPLMGCIPKNLFDPDPRTIRGIMAVIKRGDRLLLFPEGRCTTAGAYMGIHRSTGVLIKKLRVPVISCCIEGAYICMPFWRKGFRRGRIRVTLANLFSVDNTTLLTSDEINSLIDTRLSGLGKEVPSDSLYTLKSRRLAEGLEHILFYCPKCHEEFSMTTKGNVLRCSKCGNMVVMDSQANLVPAQGSISPGSVHQWFREQEAHQSRFLFKGMEPIRTRVMVRMPLRKGRGLQHCGFGLLSLDENGWRYIGELSGDNVNLFFPIETVPAIPFDPNDNFQIYSSGKFYVFTPVDNAAACVKYASLGECAYQQFASNVQMTSLNLCDTASCACQKERMR